MSGTATSVVAFPRGEESWTREQANALLRAVEEMFHRVDVAALVHGFTDDCVVRFAEQGEFRGRDALRAFFTARLSRQKNYRLTKTLLALDGHVLANLWEGTWEDRDTGKVMSGAVSRPGGCAMARSRSGTLRSTSGRRTAPESHRSCDRPERRGVQEPPQHDLILFRPICGECDDRELWTTPVGNLLGAGRRPHGVERGVDHVFEVQRLPR